MPRRAQQTKQNFQTSPSVGRLGQPRSCSFDFSLVFLPHPHTLVQEPSGTVLCIDRGTREVPFFCSMFSSSRKGSGCNREREREKFCCPIVCWLIHIRLCRWCCSCVAPYARSLLQCVSLVSVGLSLSGSGCCVVRREVE